MEYILPEIGNILLGKAGNIHLLLTDVIMPGMGGKELAERIQNIRTGIRVLFMSGYSGDVMKPRGQLGVGVNLLQKPFPVAELAQQVRDTLDR